ncbi:pyruvate dehydrogenase E1 component alpha subunit [Thermanaeromonas toyohensis ToBE]|uniref:Pyruvate dehydrogenase E1 component alpha subunit n=1 Tax=Thermanaeromonas toyohensis ToBE TaxID=698762 RepID=A0A1W1VYR6_9FIRM|nr:thiamine pyrophosphate-dependent dehydrogenase E1 component subunit alpha [Thermanaeromonas toyohensis]SMB98403.1 pyruvate dehydrogenase E1 component alpha subunit [Thermanaeromonas toyohensis ToBE]
MELKKELLLDFYRTMVLIRQFELKAAELFAAGRIPGFVHLYVGEEAVATGVCANLTPRDYITSTHRGHAHLIAKGGDIKLMMAELFGKKTGYCKGKGGSMHIADVSLGILGANGIVGAGQPIAAGAALACKVRGEGAVAVCFFGDGAANRGTFHEALNLASIWKLPVVYVCENNMYGISNYQRNSMNIADIADRATSYGIPGVSIDGNDVVAVYEAAAEAIARARRGEGPSLIEAKTWRHRGHFEGDPQVYKDPKEQEDWLKKDPISRLAQKLLEMNYATPEELNSIEAHARTRIEEAVAFAENSPEPEESELLEDVYA